MSDWLPVVSRSPDRSFSKDLYDEAIQLVSVVAVGRPGDRL